MTQPLINTHIAFLAEDQYEDLELWYPLLRMQEAGAKTTVIGMPGVEKYHSKHGYPVEVDASVDEVSASDFDAIIIPGGYAPDKMRRHPAMLALVRDICQLRRVVAMICHAGWVPISAGIMRDKRVTSVAAIKDDLINAGAEWIDAPVVQDGNLISSRRPSDLPDFCRTIIAAVENQKLHQSLEEVSPPTNGQPVEAHPPKPPTAVRTATHDRTVDPEEPVDELAWQSFPASDPPPY
jgi:protease I